MLTFLRENRCSHQKSEFCMMLNPSIISSRVHVTKTMQTSCHTPEYASEHHSGTCATDPGKRRERVELGWAWEKTEVCADLGTRTVDILFESKVDKKIILYLKN